MSSEGDLMNAFSVKTNDQLMCVYVSSLIRALVAFHDLVENKIQNKVDITSSTSASNGVVDTLDSQEG